MNEDIIADLKQFIRVTVSQQTSDLRGDMQKLDQKVDTLDHKVDKLDQKVDTLDHKVDKLDQKVDTLSVAIADAIDVSNNETDIQIKDHSHRIALLEKNAA